MKAYRLIFILLALASLSIAREMPEPVVGNIPINSAEEPGHLTPEQWVQLLSPVLAASQPQD